MNLIPFYVVQGNKHLCIRHCNQLDFKCPGLDVNIYYNKTLGKMRKAKFLFWLVCFLRTHAVFVFPITLIINYKRPDTLSYCTVHFRLEELEFQLLDLDFGLGIYYSCYRADDTSRKSHEIYSSTDCARLLKMVPAQNISINAL